MRRRSTPWIQRWSRPIMAGIATVGAIGTAYLTYEKFLGGNVACPTSGCEQVLSSPYAMIFGVPLTIFGFLGYFAMGLFAIAPLLISADTQKELRSTVDQWTGLLLFMGGTAMTIFSGYLMYLLVAEIKAVCIYCVGSALLSVSLFVLSIVGRDWIDVGQLFFTGILVGMAMLLTSFGLYAQVNQPEGDALYAGPPITTTSNQAQVELAQYLTASGAKMYGAYWCPHCHDQKQLFGAMAAQDVPYVECDEGGFNPQPAACREAGIRSYPTWDIDGQQYPGVQSLTELASLSGYQGATNF